MRLVTTPERVVLAETQRARTTLAMLGHHVEGVVVNRVAVGDQWPAGARRAATATAWWPRATASPTCRCAHAPYTDDEPVGVEALLALADVVLGASRPARPRRGAARRRGARRRRPLAARRRRARCRGATTSTSR